ncbi:MFS transporter, partial [Clostridia bacterium OttesenSCG-928-F22]|nr:MFS transporter [Clostridia bacterium OttesenSCG-928-F22]
MEQTWKKNTAIFMSTQALSLFGSSLVQYAITWHITLTTQSGVYTMLSIIFGFLPTFFLSPFAGVWADRYNRKHLIMLADGGIALCTLILAIVFLTGSTSIWLLLIASAIRALGSAIQTPCVGAMLPDIVPKEKLVRVNGINSSIQSLIALASPMVSGALMSFAALEYIFFIDVITAAIAIFIMFFFLKLPFKKKERSSEKSAYFKELKMGFSYIARHKYLVIFFIACAAFFFLAAPVAFLTPLQVTRSFSGSGNEVWLLSAIEMAFSIGMILGGLLLAIWGGMKNRVHTMVFTGVIMGAATFVLGLPISFVLYL